MAKMCPMKGCAAKQGMCNHDKMMVLMALMVGGRGHRPLGPPPRLTNGRLGGFSPYRAVVLEALTAHFKSGSGQ
ncbi:MAG: hypothetical protein IPJ65_38010 [Archangiaceae bacterium]|nr:hypothetical protein [Archangiaceae bacterium]